MPNDTDQYWDDIRSMVNAVGERNLIDVQANFDRVMQDRVGAALTAKRADVAASIYGGKPQSGAEDQRSTEDDSEGDE